MKKSHVKQHFIPQCYLRNFSENGKFVFVYSKKNLVKGFPKAISNTACDEHFYSIPVKYFREMFSSLDPNFVETEILSKQIERPYSILLNKIIQAYNSYVTKNQEVEIFSKVEKDQFSALIAVQYLRLPQFREKYWSAQKKVDEQTQELFSAFNSAFENLERPSDFNPKHDEDYISAFHAELFLDEELISGIQDQILKKTWIYYVNDNNAFYTSDNPINLKGHLPKQNPFYEGFGMNGVEIILPISSNILLTIWDENVFLDKNSLNNKFVPVNDKLLRAYNCMQYISSIDEVYSKKNDFNLITLLKHANGDVNKELYNEKPSIKINGK